MSLKTMMVAVSGGSASAGAVEAACRIAARVGAHLEGFHAKPDPTQIVTMTAEGYNLPMAGEWIDQLIADTEAVAAKGKAMFETTAARHGLAVAASGSAAKSATWQVESGYGPLLVSRRARFFDLAVLGRSDRVVEQPYSDTIEETLVRSGRPVLLAPAKPADAIGRAVAVGWNGSAEAVHALTAALPILEAAEAVEIVTIGEADEEAPAPLLDYLAAHGVRTSHRHVLPVKGVGPGEQLLAEARDGGADLLVMGAYGHRPWREHLFGGATRQVIGISLLPILLAH